MKNNIVKITVFVAIILLIPVFGNLFVEGWNWGPLDFVIIGSLLFLTGLAIDIVSQKLTNPIYKILAVIIIIGVLMAIWVELAVDGVSQMLGVLFS